ncbi:15-cis-phytoene desaturase chloroplastic/chromoplastic [Phtheirospermum japonicum]|uniref:15-cis-phytoene desaturase chloroplastic/chromoplastic n=1 Tax=Phtheirospermum japonicum TaxID=374723 RepID=A0A830CUG9_9LAMI|nr:15-cis-phytoene desaturase chloroplastic/chromoplastic [Phtheirospermum japonicum]
MSLTVTAHAFPLSSSAFPSSSSSSSNFKNLKCFKPPNATSQQISLDSSSTSENPSPSRSFNKTGVIVVGAGLAGLAAATRLQSENIPFLLLEASDAVGGRVRTDFVDGYTLDRGFQIFITAYPEAQKLLDYGALDLQRFYSGAQVFYDGRFHTVADPQRHFADALQSLTNPIGSVVDKLLIGLTRIRVLAQSDYGILTADEVKTIDLLRRIGFSDSILDRFFRPFFGGIFFDRDLETTSRLFNFVFRCLALGDNTLPKNGISAIPEQLAGKLNPNSIKLNSRVASIDYDSEKGIVVNLDSGELLRSDLGVILAVEEFEAVKILAGKPETDRAKLPVRSTTCLYFSLDSDKIPVKDPVLFLNGSGRGIVNNMFFVTNVAPSYGPPGKGLVSVSLIGMYDDVADEELVERVVKELSDWFGEAAVGSWRYLRMYRVGFAQPNQCPPTDLMKDPRVRPGLYVCGDYTTSATFDGALVSGRRAVEALLRDRARV